MEKIYNPKHYNNGKIEVLEMIEDQGLNFNRGNAVKYVMRAGIKEKDLEVEDLLKAIFYLEREVELLQAKKENRAPIRPNEMVKKKR